MAYLLSIAVEASKKAIVPKSPIFRWTAHHVKEVFLTLLPATFVLDGSSKVQITCGPRGSEPHYQQVLGTSNFFLEAFDFPGYYAAKPPERDRLLLQVLTECFCDIASRTEERAGKCNAILSTAHDVLSRDFRLRILSSRLSRVTPCGQLKVNVYRNLNRQIGEVWSAEVVTCNDRTLHTEWMGEIPHYLNLTDFYRKSAWDGDWFKIQDRLGTTVYELDVSPFLAGA